MGCSSSVVTSPSPSSPNMKRRKSVNTVQSGDGIESFDALQPIRQRNGNPSAFKEDGYDIGMRIRIKGVHQSFFVGVSRKTMEKVTIKEHHLKQYRNDSVVLKEVQILHHLSHPVIPRLLEVFSTDKSLYMVTEYLEPTRINNFIDFKAKKCQLSLLDIRHIMKSVAEAVAYCHDQGFVLRDLTPTNILVKRKSSPEKLVSPSESPRTSQRSLPPPPLDGTPSSSGTLNNNHNNSSTSSLTNTTNPFEVKIVDFTFAVREGSAESTSVLSSHPLFDWGMVPYTPPEVLFASPMTPAIPASDMWSLGVLLFLLVSGHLPFGGYEQSNTSDDHVLIHNIRQAHYVFDDTILSSTNSSPSPNPTLPASAGANGSGVGGSSTGSSSTKRKKSLPSVWKESGESVKKLIRRLLVVDTSLRMTAREFLKSPWLEVGMLMSLNHGGMASSHALPSGA